MKYLSSNDIAINILNSFFKVVYLTCKAITTFFYSLVVKPILKSHRSNAKYDWLFQTYVISIVK